MISGSVVAHFIGGPWHGEDRQVDGKARIYGVTAGAVRYSAADARDPYGPSYEEFEYRRMGFGALSAGFALYEYVEPTAEVEIVIRKRVPKSKVEETRAELVRTLGLPDGGRLYYSGPARD